MYLSNSYVVPIFTEIVVIVAKLMPIDLLGIKKNYNESR